MRLGILTGLCVLAIGVVLNGASAQETRKWSDIDCAQSKIIAPSGLKCRSTQLYSGSDSMVKGADAGGQFQRWISYGTLADGSQVFFYASEAGDPQSWTRPLATLEDVVRGFNRDFQRFTNPKGDACVAVRKLGDRQSAGYKWYLVAGKCAAKGASISEAEIANFLAATSFRS